MHTLIFEVSGEPKRARMKGARNGLFFDMQTTNKRFFMMHISAMVPPYGPAGTSGAFPQRITGTLVGQEHAPTETSRPLSPGPDPCGRLQSFEAARPWLRLTLGLGRTVLGHTYIPRLQSEGNIDKRFAMAFMYSLSSANTSELSSS